MPRATRNTTLESRSARSRLDRQPRPFWTPIEKRIALGYLKGKRGGTWQVRWRTPEGRYVEHALANADDARDADGRHVLDYFQAQGAARDWVSEQEAARANSRCYRVKDAIAEYLKWYRLNRRSFDRVRGACNHHILPALGDIPVTELTSKQIRAWHQGLAERPARLRSRAKTDKENVRPTTDRRARKATANRVLSILKAALNSAWSNDDVPSDTAWRKVKPFKGVDAPRQRHLTEAECKQLLAHCEPDLQCLVQAALFTGARYGELCRLKVRDVDTSNGTVHIADSKSGRPRDIPLNEAGLAFFSALAEKRFGEEWLLQHSDGTQWQKSHQTRPLKAACQKAGIEPPITFHGLRHTYGSALARAGTPLQVIAAALGHSDTRITERHYAHLLPDHVAQTIRQNLPDLGGAIAASGDRLAPLNPLQGRDDV